MICSSRCPSEAAVSTYVSRTVTSEPATKSAEYHSVRNSGRGYLPEDIADPADGLQQLPLEWPIDLVAQAADQHVDNVGLRIEVVLPHVRENHRFRDDLPGVAHQELEQRELTRP